jgi:hypothetical protein
LFQPVPRACEQPKNLLFCRRVTRQKAIAVQVHVTAKQHAFWLRKLLRRDQRVESPTDRFELISSSSEHSCQSVAPRLVSDLLGITQQTVSALRRGIRGSA